MNLVELTGPPKPHYPSSTQRTQSPKYMKRHEYPPMKLAKRLGLVRSYISQVICPVTKAIATACARVCAPSLPKAL
jgi:hypothetical protein